MWWMLQIIASLAIIGKQFVYRSMGVTVTSIILILLALSIAEPSFFKSFKLAPNFFQPYFLCSGVLAVGGWLVSILFFKESPNLYQYIGAVLAVGGSALLVVR